MQLDWVEFKRALKKLGVAVPLAKVRKLFAMFDEDGSGRINMRNLRRISDELGRDMSDEELRDILDAADRDGDGELTFQDFFRVMRRRGKAWIDCSDSD